MQTSQSQQQMSQAQTHFLDIYRSMTRAANDALTATLHTTELVSAQSHMIGNQMAQAVEFWRSAYRAVGEAQMNLMHQVQSQVGQATETVRQAYDLTRKASDEAARMTTQVASHAAGMMSEQNGSGQQQRRSNGSGSHSRSRSASSGHGRKRSRSRSAERRA